MIKASKNCLDIAFASSNKIDLDAHFGSCHQLTIYRLSPDNCEHLKALNFSPYEGHNQQKINDRLSALNGCFAVYCLACGNPIRKQLLAQGIRVIIHSQDLIENILLHIQANWPGEIAFRQERQLNKKQHTDYLNKLATSKWQ